jgi:hypothetical protein
MSVDRTNKEVDFICVRTMTPRQIVSLLLNRFPAIRDLVCPDESSFDLPTVVYDSFARIVRERSDDSVFIRSVAEFIDELAESRDPLIGEVLYSSLLEGIAADAQLAQMISRCLSPRSRRVLEEVESKIYGRPPLG